MVAVSIVMPAYNAEATIDRAIDGAVAQTVGDFELIVVDDESEDGTVDLVRRRAASDRRIRLLQMERNGGPSVARNAALDVARGEWITLLDADDTWRPDRLETLLRVRDCDFVADQIIGYDAIAGIETGLYLRRIFVGELDLVKMLRLGAGYDLGFVQPLMRRSFLEGAGLRYAAHLRYGEDYLFYIRALVEKARFRVLPYAGYIYTTPVGRVSVATSPYSHTRADKTVIADALEAVAAECDATLTPAERAAFVWRANFYRTRIPFDGFVRACRRRDPAAVIRSFAGAPLSVSRHLGQELWARYGRASA